MDIIKTYKRIKKCLKTGNNKLPSNCFFLNKEEILALRNPFGDARYPYARDGLVLWAYSSGSIVISDSNYFVVPYNVEGKEPYISFFGGVKNKDGKYDYFSINGAGDTVLGKEKVEKYTVFTTSSVIYLRVYKKILFALELSINATKDIIASIKIENLSKNKVDVYASSFVNALLTHSNYETEETKWFRRSTITENGALLYSVEDLSRELHLHSYLVIKRASSGTTSTTSTRMFYIGDKNGQLSTSSCLRNGKFVFEKQVSQFIDMAVYGDLIKKSLEPAQSLEANYKMSLAFSDQEAQILLQKSYNIEENAKYFEDLAKEAKNRFSNNKNMLNLEFTGLENDKIQDSSFNDFIYQVVKQVDYCSRAKNSSLMMLGVRDIAQMLEAMCMWNPAFVKEKLLWVFDFVFDTGRTPRQISNYGEDGMALFDTREFIDQGQWLITTVYKYICYTNDYSVLDEECGYSHFEGFRQASKSSLRDSLFSHLERMINYLISNIDEDTHCLKTLFGDWNDAVDGLGAIDIAKEGYGNGVSIMASFHLYQNLNEFISMASKRGLDVSKYIEVKDKLFQGILKYGVVYKENEKRIVHGWGNNRSFYVGSFDDVDGINRYSSTSHSFYITSGFYKKDSSLIDTSLNAFKALDSKYGLLTFSKPFLPGEASKVGRIVNLPPGTAENAATYIHAAMYAVKALGMIHETDFAFEQMMKLIPITHDKISTSPFVMPNSYGYNPDLGVDGESMNDWYTGSSNTLLKALVEAIIGICPNYDNSISISANKLPLDEVKLEITIKGKRIKLHQIKGTKQVPIIRVNNQLLESEIVNLNNISSKTINIDIEIE